MTYSQLGFQERTIPESTEIIDIEEHPDIQGVQKAAEFRKKLLEQVGQVVIGQNDVVDQLLISLFAGGHSLLVGVPGLAKTLLVKTLSESLGLTFRRIQFTPDLMPSDITGTEMIQEDKLNGERRLQFTPGPLFAQVILADEINRTPPKTQSALLEAMQENQVTVAGQRHQLPTPFFVLATQNPIEQEGTYPLPEAQLDRFMFQILINYPDEESEFELIRRTTEESETAISALIEEPEIVFLQQLVRRIPVADPIIRYAMKLVRLSRPNEPGSLDIVNKYVEWGAGPRAGQYLILGAKARAMLRGEYYASTADVNAVAPLVLGHRLIRNFEAEADGIATEEILARLVEAASQDSKTPGLHERIVNYLRPSKSD